MIELIFIIIVCTIVYRRVQNAKGNGSSVRGNHSMPNTTVTTANQQNTRPQSIQQQNPGPNPYVGQNNRNSVFVPHGAGKPPVHRSSAQEAIQEAKEDGHSTTAYLMEKAEADAREHAKEKYEEQKRLYETRGGLAVAERYLEGETIPNGKRCVNCGYCGAENLIPMIPRTRYSCYFCREPLG
ncbi:MAG: hypothetical protein K2L82_07645 [Lachnospiraceae bacterium]|nr:hypothetical protein [Lachnospiraceae bacterium]